MKKILFLSFYLASGLIISCKDKNPEPTDFACDKQAKITSQVLGDIPITIEYDSQGRVSKVFRTDGEGLIENYVYESPSELHITRNFKDGGIGNKFDVELNEEGYIETYETVDASAGQGYQIKNTYNSEGYLVESNDLYEGNYEDTRTVYIYKDGNLMTAEAYTGGSLEYKQTYTYTTDVNKADILFNQSQPDMYGKISKNLIKTTNRIYSNGKKEQNTFTYEINPNGFVKSLVKTSIDQAGKTTTQTNKYEYFCF